MRGGVAAALVLAAVAGGVMAGFGVDALTSTPSRASATSSPTTPAPEKKGVEVEDPVLVANDDGGATLSATLVNDTDLAIRIDRAMGGTKDADDAPFLLVHGFRERTMIGSGESMRIGGVRDEYRLRFTDPVQVGSTLPITLYFSSTDAVEDGPAATFHASVVERGAKYREVANNGPNRDIVLNDAAIVVVPGQEKAYVAGWFSSTIDDSTELRPTAVTSDRGPIDYLHQTATGGPSGLGAQAGKKTYLNVPPYLDVEPHGDADYFRASDVMVGEKITVTMRFPSGDVVTKFRVVQGRPDGTI